MAYATLLKTAAPQAENKRAAPAPAPRAIGNQALLRLRPVPPQARPVKLAIGLPGDALEQEAERAAGQLMRGEAASLAAEGAPVLRRAAPAAAPAGDAPKAVHQALNQGGETLDAGTRAFFEPRLGADLGGVRVHRAGLADAAARSVGARAFTVGTDIVFADGAYAPSSGAGRALIGHELAHVVQQTGAAPRVQRQLADPDIDKAMAVINKVLDSGRALAAKLLPGLVDPPAAGPAPVPAAADPAQQTAIEDKVLAGAYVEKGQYTGATDAAFRFDKPELQAIFEKCRAALSVPPAKPAARPAGPVTNIGDSPGKPISGQPEWINAFQEKLATTPAASWTRDTRLAQKLVEAALRAAAAAASPDPAARATPSNVGELYSRVGASTVNERATILGGVKGGQAWCDTATIRAIALGLMKGGLRFKTGVPPVKPEKPDPASTLTALTEEIRRQTTFFHQHWYNDVTKPRPGAPKAAGAGPVGSPAPRRLVGGREAWTTPLQPGDDITVVNGGNVGPLSGHVATVISETFKPGMDPTKAAPAADPAKADPATGAPATGGAPSPADPAAAGPKPGDVISSLRYVSGNARQSAVRAEEVQREMPPANYDWSKMTGPSNAYTAAKSAAAAGTRAWNKSGLDGPLQAAMNELYDQAANSGYKGEPDWTKLATGNYEGTDIAKLPGYAKAYELAKQALPKWQAEAQPLDKMNQMITNRKSELPVSRTDDPKFQAGRDAPVLLDHSWVVSVVRSSLLDAQRVAAGATKLDNVSGWTWDQAQLDKLSLEPLDGTIDTLYPGALDAADKR
jgi:hypothetical protein